MRAHDVSMRDATSKTKFIFDSIECIWIVGDYFGAQYLDRNRFAERSVDGAIHHSHAAVADESFDAIAIGEQVARGNFNSLSRADAHDRLTNGVQIASAVAHRAPPTKRTHRQLLLFG